MPAERYKGGLAGPGTRAISRGLLLAGAAIAIVLGAATPAFAVRDTPPFAIDDTATPAEDSTANVNVLANDTDIDQIWRGGVAFTAWGRDDYLTSSSDTSLSQARAAGAQWIALLVTEYMSKRDSNAIAPIASATPSTTALTHAIDRAHELGMKVLLKPHVDVADGTWRGEIAPSNTTTWFNSYRTFINKYADLARNTRVEEFSVGTELKTMSPSEAEWRTTIAGVRSRFDGPITYAANWDEAGNVAWWDAVDYIGVDGYFPLGTDSSAAALQAQWQQWVDSLHALSDSVDRRLVFTEIGYQSVAGCTATPWSTSGNTVDQACQARAYDAALSVWLAQSWFNGMFWWDWSYLPNASGQPATGFSPQGKQAQTVLTNRYGALPAPGPSGITVASRTQGAHGSVQITGGGSGVSYQPAADYCGPDSFTYTLNGGSTATVSVTVGCVDDPPVAVDDSASLNEDAGATAVPVLANDSDIDAGPKSVATKTNGAHGTVQITGSGSGLSYQPAADYCGPDSFDYTLNGGSGATVSVDVACVDDPPVARADSTSIQEDAAASGVAVLTNDTDVDGGPKSIASRTHGTHGTVQITGSGSGITYLPDADFCGSDSFTYTLNGGSSATVSVTVGCVDDAPVAGNDSVTLQEDAGASAVAVLANDSDVDGPPLTINSKTNGAHGGVQITGSGSGLTYQPAANYCGTDSFTYTLSGGPTANVSVTVNCVNDPPAAVADSPSVQEDSAPTTVDVLANDSDVEGDPITVASRTQGAHGSVQITGSGSRVSYEPLADYCGTDSFTYTLNGGSRATVNVTVACVDDLPVAIADSATLNEDAGATAVPVLANDTDIDGGPKAVASATQGAHGAVQITGGGSGLSYQPAADYCGTDSFGYTLNGGSTAIVSVTVRCVDETEPPPVLETPSTPLNPSGVGPAVSVVESGPGDTEITRKPRKLLALDARRVRVTFAFTSTEPHSSFQCSRDHRGWRPCTSPKSYKVGPGRHVFAVRAIDGEDNVDPTPAKWHWRVKHEAG